MIRAMRESDLPYVLKIEQENFADPWTYDNFLYELNGNEFSRMFVSEQDGEICGYACMWFLFENGDITNIAVRMDRQGRGYGEELLSHLEKTAEDEGLEFLHLEVRVSNEKAIRLYKKHGFETIRIRKGYYSDNYEDAYEMMKAVGGYDEKDPGNRIKL